MSRSQTQTLVPRKILGAVQLVSLGRGGRLWTFDFNNVP
jgi:hypothetical protein